jgi:type VI protein secretion system component VasF
MTLHEADEELLRRLGCLRVQEPDAARLERVRARCQATLRQRQQQAERANRRDGFSARVLEPALVGGLSAGYLLAMLFVLLRFHGIL